MSDADDDRMATWPRIKVEIALRGETTEAVARAWVHARFADLTPSIEISESFYSDQPTVLSMYAEGPILWDPGLPRPAGGYPRDIPERRHECT